MVQSESLPKRYFVSKEDRYSQSELEGKNRAERVELMKQKSRELADSIKEQFPVVEVVQITIFAPMIQISGSGEEMETLMKNIESTFSCTLADADAPIELIQ